VNFRERSAAPLDQTRAPYFQVLLDYVDAGVIPFHTPGHKQGIGMERAFRDFVGDNVLATSPRFAGSTTCCSPKKRWSKRRTSPPSASARSSRSF